MVQSEYGWSDSQVLDLTIARLRQMVDAIRERKREQFRQRSTMAEWQTRVLAQFIAATTGKEGMALQREAAKVSLRLDEDDTYADPAASIEDYDWVEHGSATALSRNASAASVERLLSGFGHGGREATDG